MSTKARKTEQPGRHEEILIETKVTVTLTGTKVKEILKSHVESLVRDGKAPQPSPEGIHVRLNDRTEDEAASDETWGAIVIYTTMTPKSGA